MIYLCVVCGTVLNHVKYESDQYGGGELIVSIPLCYHHFSRRPMKAIVDVITGALKEQANAETGHQNGGHPASSE